MIKRKCFIKSIFCFVFILVMISDTLAFEIVRNSQAQAAIVVPKYEGQPVEKKWSDKAAAWLVEYIKKSTGVELRIVEEGERLDVNIISIGSTKLSQAAGIDTSELKWDSCKIMVKNNVLYLVGRDTFGPKTQDSLGAKGTCKAVVTFLEDYVGCKWFIPGPRGELVPKKKNIIVSDRLCRTVTPLFAYSFGAGAGLRMGYELDSPAAIANNQKMAIKLYNSVHGWNHFVPANKYFKEHPEYFALLHGKRNGSSSNHLCTTNPEVKDILIREIRQMFDEGYEWVGLGQSDGYHPCECAECEAMDNYRQGLLNDLDYRFHTLMLNPCERIHLLHKEIIDACKKSHPDCKIHLLIYDPTTWPSKSFDTYGNNVVGQVCHYYAYSLPAWSPKVWANTVFLYWWGSYHPGGIGPKFGAWQVAEQIRFMRQNGIIGIYQCGGAHNWGLEGPAYYTYGRMLGNPDLDPKDCVREYCIFAYGKASETMYEFFDVLYCSLQKDEDRILPVWTLMKKIDKLKNYPYMTPTKFYPGHLSSVTLRKLENLLEKADIETDSESSQRWLELTRLFFDFTKVNINTYKAYSDFRDKKTRNRLFLLKTMVEKWKQMRDKLLSYGENEEYRKNWFPEWKQIKRYFDDNGYAMAKIADPITLDFDKLAKELK